MRFASVSIVSVVSVVSSVPADSLVRYSNSIWNVDGTFVNLADNQRMIYWPAGNAYQPSPGFWIGRDWDSFPGGRGALTALQMTEQPTTRVVERDRPRRSRCCNVLTWNYD